MNDNTAGILAGIGTMFFFIFAFMSGLNMEAAIADPNRVFQRMKIMNSKVNNSVLKKLKNAHKTAVPKFWIFGLLALVAVAIAITGYVFMLKSVDKEEKNQ
jgi:hypothetical protein